MMSQVANAPLAQHMQVPSIKKRLKVLTGRSVFQICVAFPSFGSGGCFCWFIGVVKGC